MKFFTVLFVLVAIACVASAAEKSEKKEGLVGSSYGGAGASYAPPPCPKNYLFSCQPNLAPVPCSSGGSGGYAGAYSEHVPQYVIPQYPGAQWGLAQ